ncbi:HAD family hydrolase [Thermincola ferriacetica]
MIEISIPGYRSLILENLVLDFNGTLAFDGKLANTTGKIIKELAGVLKVYILTADTFGTVALECAGIQAEVVIIDQENGGSDKAAFVEKIGASRTVAVGNGVNDVAMLSRAALGIAVLGPEGCAGQALAQADIAVKNIDEGLSLLLNPKRITATLRR